MSSKISVADRVALKGNHNDPLRQTLMSDMRLTGTAEIAQLDSAAECPINAGVFYRGCRGVQARYHAVMA
jgi:hypothetical protein